MCSRHRIRSGAAKATANVHTPAHAPREIHPDVSCKEHEPRGKAVRKTRKPDAQLTSDLGPLPMSRKRLASRLVTQCWHSLAVKEGKLQLQIMTSLTGRIIFCRTRAAANECPILSYLDSTMGGCLQLVELPMLVPVLSKRIKTDHFNCGDMEHLAKMCQRRPADAT